jgi:hypothetical protein
MADCPPLRLLGRVWDRATQDEAFLIGPSLDWLVGVADFGGQETVWFERCPSGGEADASRADRGRNPLNFRKRVAGSMIEAEAAEVAVALWATYRSTLSGRIDWLVVLAVNDAGDVGFQARLEENDGAWRLGPRVDWPAPHRIPFDQLEIAQILDPLRDSILNLLSQGLRDASKQRRRVQRRSRREQG